MNFIPEYPIDELHGADYNPRKISDNNLQLLRESISRFGVVKPVILNGEVGVLTAGHQRTKAMKSLGMTTCPVMKLPSIVKADEIRFNLIHNSIETGKSEVYIKGVEDMPWGYTIVESDAIEFKVNAQPNVVTMIGKLLMSYGEWGSVVVDEQGKCIVNSDYAVATKQLNMKLLVYKMPNDQIDDFFYYIDQNYGEYYYQDLEINNYNQTYAQPHRFVDGKKKNSKGHETHLASNLYTETVIPSITKETRFVDFGAGECAHAKHLREQGYQSFMYEPFHRIKGTTTFDIKAIVTFIKEIYFDVKKNGLYDLVVLDSVLNSVLNNDFEDWVLTTCNALTAPDGTFTTQTRNANVNDQKNKLKKVRTSTENQLEFMSKDGYTGTFMNGVWVMQKFMDKNTLERLLKRYFNVVHVMHENRSYLRAICKEPKKLPKEAYERALNVEFNMEYPDGYKHNKHKPLVDLLVKMNSEE